jgi:outer membrane protein insertion porin family
MIKLRLALISIGLFLMSSYAVAATFVINQIKVKGLQRVSKATVLHYLPVNQGESFNTANSNKLLQSLYKTDFFSNVTLYRDNNNLVIKVQERPTISEIDITGNKQIPQDKLKDALNKLGLQKGRFLNHATLEEVKQALQNEYYAMGRYNVRITITQTKEPRNRVAIGIQVSEGAVTKVAGIKILGNNTFSEEDLLDGLHLSTPGLTTFFTRRDEYSEDKLHQSQQDILNYYLDRGYIQAKIDSTQVTMTPDRKQVYIVIKITEGAKFTISGYQLNGKLLNQREQLLSVVKFKKGDTFSRQNILNATRSMTLLLGDLGYAFAQVNPKPSIDAKNKTVFIDFDVQPGNKYYIRNITFEGNDDTSQIALRKQLYQMEGGLYSTQKIHDSIFELQQDSYLAPNPPPQITPVKVAGTNNMLDLDVKLAERLSAQFQLSLGYSEAYGFMVSTGITQSNFMGSGKTVGFNISLSSYQKNFSVTYNNPYYTPDGVSRSISVFGSTTSSDQLSVAEYNTDSYGANVNYGFPLSVHSSLNLGYGFSRTILKQGGTSSNIVDDFLEKYGNVFDQLLLTAGWSYRTTDRPILPTKGDNQSIDLTVSTPIDKNKLLYYKLTYTNDWYQPLNKYFILHAHGVVGYGNGYGGFDNLPFFQNYYAGGLGVPGINRAYYPFSLGPRDNNNNPIGGNLLVGGHLSLILPDFYNAPTVRTSVFVDGGNVFNTHVVGENFSPNQFRYSYGLQVEWWTPLNLPLIFSFAEPINNRPGDNLDAFQFTIGTMY